MQIHIEISEHDAHQLLKLARTKAQNCDKIWEAYWQRLVKHLEREILRSQPNYTSLDTQPMLVHSNEQ